MKAGIKRVYDPPGAEDGYRVLVDRVWPRGLRKEALALDAWEKELAPSRELRRWFGHQPERWEAFRERYFAELASREQLVSALRARARRERVTLLFSARDADHNNAVALLEYLKDGPRGAERHKRGQPRGPAPVRP